MPRPQLRDDADPSGKSGAKNCSSFISLNPLKSLDSDERIQGNPNKSNSSKRGFSQRNSDRQENPNGCARHHGGSRPRGQKAAHQNAGAASANVSLVIVMMVMVVVMMMIVVVMIIVMMVVVVVMVVLSNDHRLLFGDAGAFVLGSQNVLCIRNGIQQLGK
jgi:hypothetical protein